MWFSSLVMDHSHLGLRMDLSNDSISRAYRLEVMYHTPVALVHPVSS